MGVTRRGLAFQEILLTFDNSGRSDGSPPFLELVCFTFESTAKLLKFINFSICSNTVCSGSARSEGPLASSDLYVFSELTMFDLRTVRRHLVAEEANVYRQVEI